MKPSKRTQLEVWDGNENYCAPRFCFAFTNYFLLIYSFIQQYLLSYFVPGSLLNTADTKMNKIGMLPTLMELTFSWVGRVKGTELITLLFFNEDYGKSYEVHGASSREILLT